MTFERVAVIDIGKTNAKVALVDRTSLSEVAVRKIPNGVVEAPPYPHVAVERLWAFILDSLSALQAECGVDAIAVTTHGACAALLRADGELALPILDYEHAGPESRAADYDALRPDFAETGSPRLPAGLNLGAQLYWQQQRFPDRFGAAREMLTYPQYWAYRLTGVAAAEVTSLGCHTDLWEPGRNRYSSLVDRLGWRRLMPPLRHARDVLGPIRPEIATATGLKANCPVVGGIHDSNASLLPHLMCEARPFAVVSTGTWVIAMAVGGDDVTLDPRRDTLVNVDADGQPVRSARFMGGRDHARAIGAAEARYGLDDLAAVVEREIMLLPAIEGGIGPFAGRSGGWTVPPETLSAAERAAAAALYLASMTVTCLDMIGAGGTIVVEGSFTGDPILLALIAALSGRKVKGAEAQTTGTSIGAAMLVAAGPKVSAVEARGPEALGALLPAVRAYGQHWETAVTRDMGALYSVGA
ncbi:FGGY-family carbohydrate kinase [Jiella sp. MQZ9-1]|uniref:FGGY-family carbohydrate kinase n=1 Tax=Jiella flava TaxID=2816857 RepID=A0A939FZZ5_9HYPH|nr:FGGY-family carbohydrate kinase [Jiella flava]MBO0663088.1 FGGY-family carbohydrate kinase [Jiella flava]MCD2471507.1 FGGY-family carbohydrate kinase [Jiella flava]